jgi:regulator of sirC expression with transglutaminase-like and TPR domain
MAFYGRGLIYFYKQDYDYAITDLTGALHLNPNNTFIREKLENIKQKRNEYAK